MGSYCPLGNAYVISSALVRCHLDATPYTTDASTDIIDMNGRKEADEGAKVCVPLFNKATQHQNEHR